MLETFTEFALSDNARNLFQILGVFATIFIAGLGGYFMNWWRYRNKAFPDLIMINLNTIEFDDLGNPTLVPRTAQAETPISQVIRDPMVAGWIVKTAKHLSTEAKLVTLSNQKDHNYTMKQVRNRVSELALKGHLARMAKIPHEITRCWCALTYESYGSGNNGEHAMRILRIQVITQDDLKLFCKDGFVEKLNFISGEGGHTEEAALLKMIANEEYANASQQEMTPEEFRTKNVSGNLRYVALPIKA